MKRLDNVTIDLTKSNYEVPEYVNRGEYILFTKSDSDDYSERLVYIPKDTLDKIKSGENHTKYRFIDANLNDEIYINSDRYVGVYKIFGKSIDPLSDEFKEVFMDNK